MSEQTNPQTEQPFGCYLQHVARQLDLPPRAKAQVIRELRSHLEEVRDELLQSGETLERAQEKAEWRVGNPDDIARRLQAVHGVASWKSILIALVPFVALIIGHCGKWIGKAPAEWTSALMISVIALATFRELISGRRPFWVATWLAVILVADKTLLNMAGVEACSRIGVGDVNLELNSLLLLCTAAVSASWRSSNWRKAVIASSLALIATTGLFVAYRGRIDELNSVWALVSTASAITMLLAIAFRVFAHSEYSNAAQASLFLFMPFSGSSIAAAVIAATVTFLYGRCQKNANRQWLILGGMTACNTIPTWIAEGYFRSASKVLPIVVLLPFGIITALPVALIVLAPVWWERRNRANRPEIAA